MKFTIISMSQGGLKDITKVISEYTKRIQSYAKIDYINLTPQKAKNISIEVLRENDRLVIEKNIPKQSLVFVCDENGASYTSMEFAKLIESSFLNTSHMVFVLGPAYGLSRQFLQANKTFRLSDMTLQHEIANLVLSEQLYRVLTIIHNHPYHY